MTAVSPLAPAGFPALPEIRGVYLATCAAEIKYKGRNDLLLVGLAPATTVGGVFTRSKTAGAPVVTCQRHLSGGNARALVVNSGNANAFTGNLGDRHCDQVCSLISDALQCSEDSIFLASTGVIGEFLPIERILDALPGLADSLSPGIWKDAAEAIITTDTFAKGATATARIGGTEVRINGIAKGSGMIAPDMATMLAFVFTDANLPADMLQSLLMEANELSFNATTVDSDTSTSDTCLLFATGAAGNDVPVEVDGSELDGFRSALLSVMQNLALQVVRDGEGASKLIEVRVTGAEDQQAAKQVALSIANSPLVKTAIAGEDANWGRVVMAVGKSGERVDRDLLKISMGGILITDHGMVVDGYDEGQVDAHLSGMEILVEVDIGLGQGHSTVWTCDLTHGYITINADYRS